MRKIDRAAFVAPALVVLVLAGFLVHDLNAQSAARYALTGAIWDDHSLSIDGYPLGADRAELGGRSYSDKAPGQPLLAVPAYAAYRLVGGEAARIQRVEGNLGLWWVTLWSATIPAAVLVGLMAMVTGGISRTYAAIAALLTWSGTVLAPFSTVLFGHVLATSFLFAAFTLLRGARGSRLGMLAGLLTGLSVLTEYTAVLGALVLVAWILVRQRGQFPGYVAGGLSPLVGLMLYNLIAFGSPWTVSYQFNAFHEVTDTARPLLHMFTPATLANATQLIFGSRGLLIATPIVLVGLWGLFRLTRSEFHPDIGWVGIAMFAVFLLIPLFWGNPWGGDSPGPRYMTPAMAFLAPGVAVALREARLLTIGISVASSLTMGLAALTNPVAFSADAQGGLGGWMRLAIDGQWASTISAIGLGPIIGTTIYIGASALALGVFMASNRTQRVRLGSA